MQLQVWYGKQAFFFQQPISHIATHSLLLFCGTYLFYCLHDYSSVHTPIPLHTSVARIAFWQKYGRHMLVLGLLVAALFLIVMILVAGKAQVLVLMLLAALSLLYSFRLLPAIYPKRIKDAALWKIGVLAGTWTLATTLLALPVDQWLATNTLLYQCCRFCFMLVLCIPFDVRDDEADRPHMTKTLLQWFPVAKLVAICWALLAVQVMITTALSFSNCLPATLAMLLIAHQLYCTKLAIRAIRQPDSDGTYLWLDTQMLLQTIIAVGGWWWLA